MSDETELKKAIERIGMLNNVPVKLTKLSARRWSLAPIDPRLMSMAERKSLSHIWARRLESALDTKKYCIVQADEAVFIVLRNG